MNQLNSAMLLFTLTLGHAWAGLEGSSNTKYGQGAGNVAGDDDSSVFIGLNAGYFNTTGKNNTFIGRVAGFNNTTGGFNTFIGHVAGFSNITGYSNVFLGALAGQNNTGNSNTFLGSNAGHRNTTGNNNIFLGDAAGYYNTTGNNNTFLGYNAGAANTAGIGNVFLGHDAGFSEIGSNRLFIANTGTANPLIYGEFDNQKVTLNGNLEVVGPNDGIVRLTDVKADATTKGARLVLNHYNNAALPVYLFGAASTPVQNFVAFGGGNSIGSAATQLDFFTGPTTTTATGTSRMTINGAGNIGMGVTSPVHPLQMASGALVTMGGVWTNASSRDYKENIKDLSNQDAVLTLASLTPVTYNYKVDKTQGHVGFIAEDVPELVATKNRKGLSPMDIVAVLTKVAQEQQRVNQEQQTALQEQQRVNQEQQKIMESYQQQAKEQERVNQAQQQVIAELKEQNKLLPLLSTALTELKREVRMGQTTALAD